MPYRRHRGFSAGIELERGGVVHFDDALRERTTSESVATASLIPGKFTSEPPQDSPRRCVASVACEASLRNTRVASAAFSLASSSRSRG